MSTASPMIKSARRWRRGIKKFTQLELHVFPSCGVFFSFIHEFLLDYREDKSARRWRRGRKKFMQLELHVFPSCGVFFSFIYELLLDYREDNLMILVTKSLFPY